MYHTSGDFSWSTIMASGFLFQVGAPERERERERERG